MILDAGAAQSHPTPALRAHGSNVDLEAVLIGQAGTVIAHGHGQEMVLKVGIADSGPAANEGAGLEVVAGTKPVVAQQPAHAN